jgi:signal transduction histidine kinase
MSPFVRFDNSALTLPTRLQTPLTILQGELEVALRAPRTPDEYRRVLTSALEESDRIASLVEGLLLLSRADAGVLRMDHQPIDLARLVAEVCEQGQVLAHARGVILDLGLLTPMTIHGDPQHLRRLLLNLVDNGLKYTLAGGRRSLRCTRTAPGPSCASRIPVSVCSRGTGTDLPRFYRAPAACRG